jgi:hypothetical protein
MTADVTDPTEAEFQEQVVQLARLCGWRHLHVRRSIGRGTRWTTATNLIGWVDLTLMRPPDGLIFAELKRRGGQPTPEQTEMVDFLSGFPFALAVVWTPDDWPAIETALGVPRPGETQ